MTALLVVVTWANFNHFDYYMASRLFKLRKRDAKTNPSYKEEHEKSDFIEPTYFCNSCHCVRETVPKSWQKCCCPKSRPKKGLYKALATMDTETNIIKIVKSRRYFKHALRILLTRKQRRELKERSRYTTIDPGSSTDEYKRLGSTHIRMKKQ